MMRHDGQGQGEDVLHVVAEGGPHVGQLGGGAADHDGGPGHRRRSSPPSTGPATLLMAVIEYGSSVRRTLISTWPLSAVYWGGSDRRHARWSWPGWPPSAVTGVRRAGAAVSEVTNTWVGPR